MSQATANEVHIEKGLRSLLRRPSVYNAFANVIGGNRSRERHFEEYFGDPSLRSVLDIGCGTGVLLESLADGVEYHGCDMEEGYIEHNREKYGARGAFYNERVGEVLRPDWVDKFDAVNAHGLMHHLSDADSIGLLAAGHRYLRPGGYMVSVDSVFYSGQPPFSRWIVSKDRGQNIRTPEEYEALARRFFDDVEVELIPSNNRIRFSVFVMKMTKGESPVGPGGDE